VIGGGLKTRAPRSRRRAWLGLVAQVVVLGGLLVAGFYLLDVGQVRLAFRGVGAGNMAGFVLLMLATRVVTAWRWRIVARNHLGLDAVTVPFLLRVGLLAEFANLWVQSIVGGEAVRIWKVARRTGDRKLGAGSVVLDRVVGTVSLVVACSPLLVVLAMTTPKVRLSVQSWEVLGGTAVVLGLAGVVVLWTVPWARSLLRRSLEFVTKHRFLGAPFAVSLLLYPLIVLAHRVGFPELAGRSWLVVAMVALLPRLGWAVPLSLFGITAVEGSVLVVGALLEVSSETLVVVVALNLLTRYLASGLGAVSELVADGSRFFGELRTAGSAGGEALVEEAIGEEGTGP